MNRAWQALRLTPILLFLWLGYAEAVGGWHLGRTYFLIRNGALEALRANWKAIEVNPYDASMRRQIQLTLLRVIHVRWPNVRIDKGAQDLIYRTASSAGPDHPATLLARAEILINFDRASEVQPVLDRLNALHPRQTGKMKIGVLR